MHPVHSFSSTAASASRVLNAPPHHEPDLSPAQSRALIDMEHNTATRIQSLMSFLDSSDPGAAMHHESRDAFRARCEALIDCSHLQDRWPGVGTAALKYPANEPPPLFSPRHQQMAQQRAEKAKELAADIGKVSTSLLSLLCLPLQTSLSRLQDLLVQLMTDTQPEICAKVESVLSSIDKRPAAIDGESCRVGSDVNRLMLLGQNPLGPTIDAVESLVALGSGNGDGRFTRSTQPEYFKKWDRALRTMERADWARFKVLVEELKKCHAELVPPAVPPRQAAQPEAPLGPPPPVPHRPHRAQ